MSSFVRPTLSTLISRAGADLDSNITGAASGLRRGFLPGIKKMHAGGMHGLYGSLQGLSDELLPDRSSEATLRRQASLKGVFPKPAIAATGPATVPGAVGGVIPDKTLVQRPDGVEFLTSGDVPIANGSATLALTCTQGGTIGSTDAGVQLTFASPIDNVGSTVTVAAPGLVGFDEESVDSLRARYLTRLRQPPKGGNSSDYEQWALAFPEVTRVWVYPKWMGAGTVGVAFTMDARANPIPTPVDVAALAAYLKPLIPVTADLYVFAPIPDAFSPVFTTLAPNNAAVQAAIKAEFADLLYREAEPGGTLPLSHIRAAISEATGVTDFSLASPAADVVSAAAHLLIPGAPVFA